MPFGTFLTLLSRTKRTANEAKEVCSAYGGSLSRFDNMEMIHPILVEEYVNGLYMHSI